jgi:hypothetical protein
MKYKKLLHQCDDQLPSTLVAARTSIITLLGTSPKLLSMVFFYSSPGGSPLSSEYIENKCSVYASVNIVAQYPLEGLLRIDNIQIRRRPAKN